MKQVNWISFRRSNYFAETCHYTQLHISPRIHNTNRDRPVEFFKGFHAYYRPFAVVPAGLRALPCLEPKKERPLVKAWLTIDEEGAIVWRTLPMSNDLYQLDWCGLKMANWEELSCSNNNRWRMSRFRFSYLFHIIGPTMDAKWARGAADMQENIPHKAPLKELRSFGGSLKEES